MRGERNLPRCRGRAPHLSRFDPKGCAEQARLLIVGASNQWFATTLSVLAIPPSGADELRAEVARHWATLSSATSRDRLGGMVDYAPELRSMRSRDLDEMHDRDRGAPQGTRQRGGTPTGGLAYPQWTRSLPRSHRHDHHRLRAPPTRREWQPPAAPRQRRPGRAPAYGTGVYGFHSSRRPRSGRSCCREPCPD